MMEESAKEDPTTVCCFVYSGDQKVKQTSI